MKILQVNKTTFGAYLEVNEPDKGFFTRAISPTRLPRKKDKELQKAFEQIGNAFIDENETIILKSEARKRFSLKSKMKREWPCDLVATVKSTGVELVRVPKKGNFSNWADVVIKTARAITERYGSLQHEVLKRVVKK